MWVGAGLKFWPTPPLLLFVPILPPDGAGMCPTWVFRGWHMEGWLCGAGDWCRPDGRFSGKGVVLMRSLWQAALTITEREGCLCIP